MSAAKPIDLNPASGRLLDACNDVDGWQSRAGNYVKAGHNAVAAIDDVIGLLQAARRDLVGQLYRDDCERMHRTDGLLAEAKGQLCRHLEDTRHGNLFGPPEYVGCGCTEFCCLGPEQRTQPAEEPAT